MNMFQDKIFIPSISKLWAQFLLILSRSFPPCIFHSSSVFLGIHILKISKYYFLFFHFPSFLPSPFLFLPVLPLHPLLHWNSAYESHLTFMFWTDEHFQSSFYFVGSCKDLQILVRVKNVKTYRNYFRLLHS